MAGREDTGSLVERYLDAHASCRLEAIVALFGSDAVLEDPVGSQPIEGLEAIRSFYRRSHGAAGEVRRGRVGPIIVRGQEATVHLRAAAQGTGFDFPVDVIYSLAADGDGRIARLRAFFDAGVLTR